MSGFVLAFVIMPAFVVGAGYVAVRLHERSAQKRDHHPAE